MAVASAYPTYRPSGLPWIGKIPEHWEVRRISTLGRVGNGSTPSRSNLAYWSDAGLPWLNSGVVHQGVVKNPPRWVTQTAVRECHLPIVPKGSVVLAITGQGKTRGTPALLGIDAAISQHLAYISIRDHVISGAYLRFALTAGYGMLRAISDDTGGTKGALTCSAVKRFSVALPPRPEQDQIVAYLRVQDAHIARFIKAKRDLIKLLTEQKQTIIEGAVTQGIEGATEKRDSGIDWIPYIPAHWETCKLKHVAVFNPSRSESTAFRLSDASVSFLPMECITTEGKLQSVENRKTSEVWEGYTYFRRNDVVMAKITPCFENGKGGLLDTLPTEIGFGTTEFIVLRAAERRIRPAFLAKLLSLRTFRVLGADAMTGAAGQQRVPLGFVKNFEIALPPLDEQDRILDALQTATAEQDVAIERIRSEIALIREYRDRLIADVVTGQVDVRGWQPGPDDVVDDAALAALGDDPDDVTEMEVDDGGE